MSAEMTGAETLVAGLARHGVDTVFGIPGTHNLEIYRELRRYGMRHVTTRHEQGAGYAADGYARTSGRPGVAVVTSGPAALNAAAALGQSYSDSVPTLLVAAGMPLAGPPYGSGLLHETRDQRAVLAGIVGERAYRVRDHAELARTVAEVFAGFRGCRPRPAYLEVPFDLLGATGPAEVVAPWPVTPPAVPAAAVAALAGLLGRARRPGLLVGGGAKGAAAQVAVLAETIGAGVLTSTNGKGVLPEDHPLALGAALHLPAAAQWLADRDVLLVVGSELAPTDFWAGPPRWPGALARIDIDADQLRINADPSLPIHADAADALDALLAALRTVAAHSCQVTGPAPAPPSGSAGAEFSSTAATAPGPGSADGPVFGVGAADGVPGIRAQARVEGARWTAWLDRLAEGLPRDAFVTADSAMACYYGALGNLPVYVPGGFAYPTGYGTLGYAVPAAIGAKTAHPGRAVIALSGDGGLMFSCQEIATAAAAGLSLPVVVFANGGYGEIRAEMRTAGIEPLGVDLPVPDFAALAVALGGRGGAVATPDELPALLAEALAHPGPTLLIVNEA